MKPVLYVMIGCPASGKSTYARDNFKDIQIISSDEIRNSLFTEEEISENPKNVNSEVFKKCHELIVKNLQEGKNVCFDATNLNQRKRMNLHQLVNKLAEVKSLVFLKSLEDLKKNNLERKEQGGHFVPEEYIERCYKSLMPPRIGVDCDDFDIVYDSFYRFYEEFKGDTSHDSKYHKETVKEHIIMTMEKAEETKDEQLLHIATFHDLGKFVCKKKNNETGLASFVGHELVSAMYYMAYIKFIEGEFSPESLEVLEVIKLHMLAHQGISEKVIQREKLTPHELHLLEEFRKIDNESKISNE